MLDNIQTSITNFDEDPEVRGGPVSVSVPSGKMFLRGPCLVTFSY